MPKDNLHIFVFTGLGSSLESFAPDQKRIPRINKSKETPDVLIIRKDLIQEIVNPRKIS